MAKNALHEVMRHLRQMVLVGDKTSDGKLLGMFVDQGDEAAFEALVRRHGKMVLGVCRNVLGNHHDAEDAFQSVFLVMVRKGKSVRPREMVGNWLYGVALQTAIRVKAMKTKGWGHEIQVPFLPEPDVAKRERQSDGTDLLDQELSRLPDKYRAVIVLCDLEGRTRKQAARQLGWPEGTVSGRLARGRAMLAKRLAKHGLVLSAEALAVLLSQNAASAFLPPTLVSTTVKAASLLATGQTAAISAKVVAITKGVMISMFLTKIKTTAVVSLIVCVVGAGVGVGFLGGQTQVPGSKQTIEGKPGGEVNAKGTAVTQPRLPDGVSEKAATDSAKTVNPPITGTPLRAGPPRVLVEHKTPLMCLAWSPDGRWVAASTEDGTIHVAEAATGKEVRSFPVGAAITALAFSPDGKRLALSQPGRPSSIWDIDAGKEQPRAGDGGGGGGKIVPAVHVAFTPDGQSAVSIAVGWMARSGPMGGGAMNMSNPGGGGCAAISPDGMIGGWCDAKGMLRIFQLTQPAPGPPLMFQVDKAQSIAFAPGGKLLAVGGDDKGVQLWDLTAQKKALLLTGLEKPATQLSFSTDGRTLAAVAADGMFIQVWDPTRSSARCQINHIPGAVGSQALSPDGKMLATTVKGGKQIFLWKATARQLAQQGPPLDLNVLTALWADLANSDADKADVAWRKLGAAGDSAVPFVRQQIRSIAVPASKLMPIEKLVAELDSDQFATRERATRELLAAGELVIIPLQRHLEKGLSAEAEKRIDGVLKKLGQPVLTIERMRVLEAIELLEQLRTAKALALLEETERDALIPQIRLAARQALQRLPQSQIEKK